jgi:ABC-type uncharacterized transport system permease subunit
LILGAVAFLAASFAFSLHYARNRQEKRAVPSFILNLLALTLLVGEFLGVSISRGQVALISMGDSMVFFAAVLVGVSSGAARIAGSQVMPLVVSPLAILLCLASLVADEWLSTTAAQQTIGGTFLVIHVLLFVLSYALFALGAAFGAMFLLVLKSKNYTPLFFKLPGLTRLETYSVRMAMLGLMLLTFAIALAFTSLHRLGSDTIPANGTIINDATIVAAIVLWVYYAVFALLRLALGWTGRRACFLSAIGLSLVLITYFFGKVAPNRGLHGYQVPAVVIR